MRLILVVVTFHWTLHPKQRSDCVAESARQSGLARRFAFCLVLLLDSLYMYTTLHVLVQRAVRLR